jgi:nitrogen-specific signal transduction histidine kinase
MVKKIPSQPANTWLSATTPPVDSNNRLAAFYELAQAQGPAFWDFLGSFFDQLPQGLILADRTGRVVLFNPVASDFLGYKPEEVVGQWNLWDFCKASANPPVFKAGLQSGTGFADEEVEMQGRKGRFKARITGLYGRDGMLLLGAIANLGSLSEIGAIERERRTMGRKISIAKIVSALAHEINNPLQTLRTSLELGLDPRKTHQRRKDYLHVANNEISRIAQIITVLRRFYPDDSNGKLSADVNSSVQTALNILDKEIKQNNIQLELELANGLPQVRLLDYQLQNIFLSLFQDILDTIAPGGTLKIRTYPGALDRVLITITDRGIRSAAETDTDPFDPMANSERGARLALGLSISREIIAEHGGTLEMTGEGAKTFTVCLPPV